MIFGVGTDCVRVERMAKSMEKPHFVKRVFSDEEWAMLKRIANADKRCESAAANFAAKEAFMKATGLGLGGFALGEIAALRAGSGMPYYSLSGKAEAFLRDNRLVAHLSLTHEGGLALAFAVLERK